MSIQRIAVIGAGTMGNGIAHVCALGGLDVTLIDSDAGAIDRAVAMIGVNLARQVAKGRITESRRAETLARVAPGQLEDVARADLVIEAVPEIARLKYEIFAEVDRLAPERAVLASNTSSISITAMAACTDRPGQVIGMHFMNPVRSCSWSRSSVASGPATRPPNA